RQNSSETNCRHPLLTRRGIRLPVVQSISDGGLHAHGPAIHFRLEGLSAQRESGRIKKARLREAVSYCYGAKRMADSASRSGETERPFPVTAADCKISKLFQGERHTTAVTEITERDECLRENAISLIVFFLLKHECSKVDHGSRETSSIAQFIKRCHGAFIRVTGSIEITQRPLQIAH